MNPTHGEQIIITIGLLEQLALEKSPRRETAIVL